MTTTYCIDVFTEVGTRGPISVFYVNGKRAGTTIDSVKRLVQGPTRQMVAKACSLAKEDGESVNLHQSPGGWISYR